MLRVQGHYLDSLAPSDCRAHGNKGEPNTAKDHQQGARAEKTRSGDVVMQEKYWWNLACVIGGAALTLAVQGLTGWIQRRHEWRMRLRDARHAAFIEIVAYCRGVLASPGSPPPSLGKLAAAAEIYGGDQVQAAIGKFEAILESLQYDRDYVQTPPEHRSRSEINDAYDALVQAVRKELGLPVD